MNVRRKGPFLDVELQHLGVELSPCCGMVAEERWILACVGFEECGEEQTAPCCRLDPVGFVRYLMAMAMGPHKTKKKNVSPSLSFLPW